MHRKTTLVVLTLFVLLFSGCLSSSITLQQPNKLEIRHNDQLIEIYGKVLEEREVNLSPAMIYQTIFKIDEGETIVYEYVDLDTLYLFNYGTSRTMDIIFDAKHVRTVFQYNNLYFFQVERKDRTVVNVLVQQSSDETLMFISGFSTLYFKQLIKEMDKDKKVANRTLKEALTTKDSQTAVTSQWNIKMIAIDNIFKPVGRMSP